MSSAFKGLSEGVEKLVEEVDEIEKARAEIKANKKLVAKPAAKARPKKRKAPAKKKVAVPRAKQLKKVKVEKLVEKMDRVEKARAVSKAKKKAAANARPKMKRAPVRKKIVMGEAKQVKKARRMTAIDEVLNIIKRHRKGVDFTMLKNKTGFADSKLRMIVYKAYKQGNIKRIARGIYVAAQWLRSGKLLFDPSQYVVLKFQNPISMIGTLYAFSHWLSRSITHSISTGFIPLRRQSH